MASAASRPAQQESSDDYSAKLLKLIPAEAITVLVAIDNVMQSKPELAAHGIYWVIIILLTIGTYAYSFRLALVPALSFPHRQAAISTAAFVVWIIALGGPFRLSFGDLWSPLYGTIILPLFTFFVPLLTEALPGKE